MTSYRVTQLNVCLSHFLSLSQAYSVYDEEIGYCQGQSFLAAVLLLHVSKHAFRFCFLFRIQNNKMSQYCNELLHKLGPRYLVGVESTNVWQHVDSPSYIVSIFIYWALIYIKYNYICLILINGRTGFWWFSFSQGFQSKFSVAAGMLFFSWVKSNKLSRLIL